jgi:Ca2+-binding RTX toxin-like protein
MVFPPGGQGAAPEPSGSSTISAAPSGVTVLWTASCPNPSESTSHYWSVAINAYHQDGSHANYISTAETGVTSDSKTQGLILQPAPGLKSETFEVTVTLSCYPYPDVLIGDGSTTVGGNGGGDKGSGGSTGGGSGGSGGGSGGGTGGNPTDPLRTGGCTRELRGTGAADVLNGTPKGDLILGLGGDDLERGRGGDDCLVAAAGRDHLLGGGGWDRLTGGGGADWLDGGVGRNAYDAGPGNDRINARNGRRDLVDCGPGEDRVRADAIDRLVGCEHQTRPSTGTLRPSSLMNRSG